jgi:Trk K+ transport system NAD-binding subunit
MLADSMSGHIVLVGLGKLGFRTYTLLRELGEKLVVIERSAENQFLETVRRDGTPLFIGDARRHALLVDANVARAKSVVVATDDDLANLETALDARRIAPGVRVVLRMFDQNMADKIREGFNIHLAVSQSAISAPAFATAAIDPSIINSYMVGDRLVVTQRWAVLEGGPLEGRTVGDILAEHQFGVVEHRPVDGPSRLFPSPDTRLASGDRLIVQGPFEAIAALRKKSRGLAEPR